MGVRKVLGFVSEGVIDRVFEVSYPLEAADGDLMLFDIVPDRLDARLLGAVSRQVDQLDIGRSQLGLCCEDSLAGVDRVVVQGDPRGTRPPPVGRRIRRASGDLPEEGHQALRIDGPDLNAPQAMSGGPLLRRRAGLPGATLGHHGPAPIRQPASLRTVRKVGADDVDPPRLWRLIGHAYPLAPPTPAIGRRQGQGKARFVEMAQIDQTSIPFFARSVSTASRSATSAGSCLCVSVRLVRCQEILARRRWKSKRSALRRTPWCSATQSASWAAVQVRVPRATSARTLSSIGVLRADALPPRGLFGRASNSPARNALIQVRTVCSCWPRWRAMRGTLQPASDRRTISSRSRVLGARPACRVRSRSSRRCSSVKVIRYIGTSLPNPSNFDHRPT